MSSIDFLYDKIGSIDVNWTTGQIITEQQTNVDVSTGPGTTTVLDDSVLDSLRDTFKVGLDKFCVFMEDEQLKTVQKIQTLEDKLVTSTNLFFEVKRCWYEEKKKEKEKKKIEKEKMTKNVGELLFYVWKEGEKEREEEKKREEEKEREEEKKREEEKMTKKVAEGLLSLLKRKHDEERGESFGNVSKKSAK